MQTSNFSKSALDPNAVSIACRNPTWYHGRHYPKLAPPEDLLWAHKKNPNEAVYIERYQREVLDTLDPVIVHQELGQDAVILCHCASQAFCHRRLVAKWLAEALGLEIPEVPLRKTIQVIHG